MKTRQLLAIALPVLLMNNVFGQLRVPVTIPLDNTINGVRQQYSGMCLYKNQVYLLPQFGGSTENLDKNYNIYSISSNAIQRFINQQRQGSKIKLPALPGTRIHLKNIERIKGNAKRLFKGFEAITIVNDSVFLTIETAIPNRKEAYCYIVYGKLDIGAREIIIDPSSVQPLTNWPVKDLVIKEAEEIGFEALTYMKVNNRTKLFMLSEYNMPFGRSTKFYQPNTNFSNFKEQSMASVDFRITDMTRDNEGNVYALNYYYEGEKGLYVNNHLHDIKARVPGFNNPDSCFARILRLDRRSDSWKWIPVKQLPCKGTNWEGLVKFDRGFLVISDANNGKNGLITTLQYFE